MIHIATITKQLTSLGFHRTGESWRVAFKKVIAPSNGSGSIAITVRLYNSAIRGQDWLIQDTTIDTTASFGLRQDTATFGDLDQLSDLADTIKSLKNLDEINKATRPLTD